MPPSNQGCTFRVVCNRDRHVQLVRILGIASMDTRRRVFGRFAFASGLAPEIRTLLGHKEYCLRTADHLSLHSKSHWGSGAETWTVHSQTGPFSLGEVPRVCSRRIRDLWLCHHHRFYHHWHPSVPPQRRTIVCRCMWLLWDCQPTYQMGSLCSL